MVKSRTNGLKVYIEWLRKLVLATRLDEGRRDFALGIFGDH